MIIYRVTLIYNRAYCGNGCGLPHGWSEEHLIYLHHESKVDEYAHNREFFIKSKSHNTNIIL